MTVYAANVYNAKKTSSVMVLDLLTEDRVPIAS